MIRIFIYICLTIFPNLVLSDGNFNLTILHTNDIHSRFAEINIYGQSCNQDVEPCFGGMARLTNAVRQTRQQEENVLFLDSGDVQTGTLWYLTYRGNASVNFMTKLGYDVMVTFIYIFSDKILSNFLTILRQKFRYISLQLTRIQPLNRFSQI